MGKFLTFLFIGIGALVHAQTITLKGQAVTYPDQYIAVFAYDDYLSQKRVMITKQIIEADGDFSLTWEAPETREYIIAINNIEATLYGEPNRTYTVNYPPYESADLKRFDRTEVKLQFANLPVEDPNEVLPTFQLEYNTFINDHAYDFAIDTYKGSQAFKAQNKGPKKGNDMFGQGTADPDSMHFTVPEVSVNELIDLFIVHIHEKYGKFYTNPYIKEYIRYTLAELELLSGTARKVIYDEYFMSQKIQPNNPGYFRLLRIFYDNALTTKNTEVRDAIYKAVNADRNPQSLLAIFENDSLFLSPKVRYLAIALALSQAYYSEGFLAPAVAATLQKIPGETSDKYLQSVAVNLHDKLIRGQQGWAIEDFKLLDSKNEEWVMSQHTGTYTYYFFYANWCSSCIKEMQIMQKQYEKYNKEIQFVAISMDSNYQDYKKYLQKHSDQKFTFLFGGGDPLIKEKMGVRSLPHAVLIDPEGRVVSNYTRKPSEGIQLDFDKIQALAKKPKGGGTWNSKE